MFGIDKAYGVVVFPNGKVVVAKRCVKGRRECLHFVAEGPNVSQNLLLACRDAELTDGDIAHMFHKLRISLPADARIPNPYAQGSRANRFSPVLA